MKKNQYKDGELHGYHEFYWPNGKLSYRGYYKGGEPHGLWENYYTGKVIKEFFI